MNFYPIKFQPIFQYRIWGGNKLKTILNKNITQENIGESWEISDVNGNQTLVSNGKLKGKTLKELIRSYKGDLIGEKVYNQFGDEFPLLIKFIDAKLPLSIQVHPNDDLAKKRHNSFGKNEMWYVMQADENAEIIVGFENKISKEKYQLYLQDGKILDLLHVENPKSGDVFNIPTGRIHAIGAGVLLAEIQQTSDVTYRIFDYDRIDSKTGKLRELHTELAIDAIDFGVSDNYKTSYNLDENEPNKLVHTTYFKTNIRKIDKSTSLNYTFLDSFVILICVEGELNIQFKSGSENLKKGESVLLPAALGDIDLISTNATVLEVFL